MPTISLRQIQTACHRDKVGQRGWYYAQRRIALPITWLAYRLGYSPNAISALMLLLGLIGDALLVPVGPLASAAGFALVYLAFLLDKVDGDLARLKGCSGPRGMILDFAYHRLTLFAFYAALGGHAYLAQDSALGLVAGFVAGFLANYLQDAQVYPYRVYAQKVICGSKAWNVVPVRLENRPEKREAWIRPLKIFRSQLLLLPVAAALYVVPAALDDFLAVAAVALAVFITVQHVILFRGGLEAELAHIETACRAQRGADSKPIEPGTLIPAPWNVQPGIHDRVPAGRPREAATTLGGGP